MVEEILVAVGLALIRQMLWNAVRFGVQFLRNQFQHRQTIPESIQAELSETDLAMVERTQNLMREQFGEDVASSIKAMSNLERLQAANRFANDLAQVYGLDIEIDVMAENIEHCGFYNRAERKARFNIVELWMDNEDPQFDAHIQNFFDTIVHELRHAVQHKAVEDPGFWEVEESRRTAWAENFAPGGYIPAHVNIRGYMMQPVENDAFTFASVAMEGVFAK